MTDYYGQFLKLDNAGIRIVWFEQDPPDCQEIRSLVERTKKFLGEETGRRMVLPISVVPAANGRVPEDVWPGVLQEIKKMGLKPMQMKENIGFGGGYSISYVTVAID